MSEFNAAARRAERTYTSCVTGSRISRLDLTGTARPVAAARRHTRDTLHRWGLASDRIDDALRVAADLVARAGTRAADGGGAGEFRLTLHAGKVSIAVGGADPEAGENVGRA